MSMETKVEMDHVATAKSIAMDMSDVHINHMSSLEVRLPMGDEFVMKRFHLNSESRNSVSVNEMSMIRVRM